MPDINSLARNTAQLRRYAAALNEDRSEGDRQVLTTLAGLVQGFALDGSVSTRLALYRAYHALGLNNWRPTPGHPRKDAWGYFLLENLEDLEPEEIGYVLQLQRKQLVDLAQAATALIDGQIGPARALIIENEEIIALDLTNIVGELNGIESQFAQSERGAIQAAESEPFDLILADINLGEHGSGLIASNVIMASSKIPTIYITAYPEKLLTSNWPDPSYLVAKPFLPETVQATVAQALFFHPRTGRTIANSSLAPSSAARGQRGPMQAKPSATLRKLRDRDQALFQTEMLIAGLRPTASYAVGKHSHPPPELWLDDEKYLSEIRTLTEEAERLRDLLKKNSPAAKTSEALNVIKEHFATFFKAYAETKGKGAAYLTLAAVGHCSGRVAFRPRKFTMFVSR